MLQRCTSLNTCLPRCADTRYYDVLSDVAKYTYTFAITFVLLKDRVGHDRISAALKKSRIYFLEIDLIRKSIKKYLKQFLLHFIILTREILKKYVFLFANRTSTCRTYNAESRTEITMSHFCERVTGELIARGT